MYNPAPLSVAASVPPPPQSDNYLNSPRRSGRGHGATPCRQRPIENESLPAAAHKSLLVWPHPKSATFHNIWFTAADAFLPGAPVRGSWSRACRTWRCTRRTLLQWGCRRWRTGPGGWRGCTDTRSVPRDSPGDPRCRWSPTGGVAAVWLTTELFLMSWCVDMKRKRGANVLGKHSIWLTL